MGRPKVVAREANQRARQPRAYYRRTRISRMTIKALTDHEQHTETWARARVDSIVGVGSCSAFVTLMSPHNGILHIVEHYVYV